MDDLIMYLAGLESAQHWCDERSINYGAGPGVVLLQVLADLKKITAGHVFLTAERYDELNQAEWKLCALEAGGVDNWSGYWDSLEDANEVA